MKAAVIKKINSVEICDIRKPEIEKGHVVLRTAYGGFCGPTEICIIEGLHPRAEFPLVFCHEFSGTVYQVNEDSSFKIESKAVVNPLVSCRACSMCNEGSSHVCENLKLIGIDFNGGFAEYCTVPEENLVKIPDEMPLKLAALAEPVGVGIHAVRGSAFKMGDNVLVAGAGPIGLITAVCLRAAGAGDIIIADKEKRRTSFAESFGFKTTNDLVMLEKSSSQFFDDIFETTGAPEVLPYIINLAKIKGFIAIVGKFDFPAQVNLHEVLFRELTIKGFRVYAENEFKQAVELIYRNMEIFEKIITDEYCLDDINEAINDFRTRKNLCKIMIKIK